MTLQDRSERLGRRRNPELRVCRACEVFFGRKLYEDGTLERMDQFRKRRHHSDECLSMLRLGYRVKGLELSPSAMESIVNDFLESVEDAVEHLFIQAERLAPTSPKRADDLIKVALATQRLRISVITHEQIPVALSRRTPEPISQ